MVNFQPQTPLKNSCVRYCTVVNLLRSRRSLSGKPVKVGRQVQPKVFVHTLSYFRKAAQERSVKTVAHQKIHLGNPQLNISQRGVATAVSAVSMIRGPQATGALTCASTVPQTGLPYLINSREGTFMQGPLRASYASDAGSTILVHT
ncbi:hypothetical protein TNCV_4520501 [Trichonephila clavipes]|nr:hypothetical protein TNCV_4520501 [Trichonephila clavipes]